MVAWTGLILLLYNTIGVIFSWTFSVFLNNPVIIIISRFMFKNISIVLRTTLVQYVITFVMSCMKRKKKSNKVI